MNDNIIEVIKTNNIQVELPNINSKGFKKEH